MDLTSAKRFCSLRRATLAFSWLSLIILVVLFVSLISSALVSGRRGPDSTRFMSKLKDYYVNICSRKNVCRYIILGESHSLRSSCHEPLMGESAGNVEKGDIESIFDARSLIDDNDSANLDQPRSIHLAEEAPSAPVSHRALSDISSIVGGSQRDTSHTKGNGDNEHLTARKDARLQELEAEVKRLQDAAAKSEERWQAWMAELETRFKQGPGLAPGANN